MTCAEVLVREDRPLSLAVAALTGVAHASPQVILLAGGKAAWHASHRGVNAAALDAALAGQRGPASRPPRG